MYSCFILKMIWFGLAVVLEMISVARVREVDITLEMPGIVRMVDWGSLELEGPGGFFMCAEMVGDWECWNSPYHCPAILYRVSQ